MRQLFISPIHDAALADRLDHAIAHKTKPLGSLGVLETLARTIGLVQQTVDVAIAQPAILVCAGDHGVVAEGVSAYPQSVTWQMVENFLADGAAINVFARQNGCLLKIVDAGVNHDFGLRPGLEDRKVRHGTANFAVEPAMTADQCEVSMEHGMALVDGLEGNVVGFGEMGIGNTTAAAAIMQHKARVIEAAVALHAGVTAPLDVLATFGGFEIALIAGAMLRAAERRMIILVDGFIVTSALLIAARIEPAVLDYCVFSHCSDEHGHRRMLAHFDARPLLQLDLRLGEGTGCALALPLLHAAVNFLREMATFESAQVSEKSA
jgi:nicotinate-nucleotide--dimethylbenzimidazole phosphoribosyltransferase